MTQFESMKRGFESVPQDEYTVDLHGVEDDPRAGIQDEEITVKRYDRWQSTVLHTDQRKHRYAYDL